MEQWDYAVAFAKAVVEEQKPGKANRKILEKDKIMELLNLDSMDRLPNNVLEAFKVYNVYIRKMRGRESWGVWWLDNGRAHGRGVSR